MPGSVVGACLFRRFRPFADRPYAGSGKSGIMAVLIAKRVRTAIDGVHPACAGMSAFAQSGKRRNTCLSRRDAQSGTVTAGVIIDRNGGI